MILFSHVHLGTPATSSGFVENTHEHLWMDFFWINCHAPELLMANGEQHRIPSSLSAITEDVE